MYKDEFVKILKQHLKIEKVVLKKSQNYAVIWGQLWRNCYCNYNLEKLNWNNKIRDALNEFENKDELDSVNKKGRILKRFAKFYKETNGEVIPDNVMGIIGDILQSIINSNDAESFYVDFTNNFNWDDGDFGKNNSCWWGCYSGSLPTFQNNGGWCIRFYNENNYGIGRTWIFPDSSDVLLGFNSYGIERPLVSKVIKSIFLQHGKELHYAKCEITNKQDSNIPYVNGNTGFVLYENGDKISDSYDLDMEPEENEDIAQCENCGCRIYLENDDYNSINDSIYCGECTGELFSCCDNCCEWRDPDDVHEISTRHSHFSNLCEDCASALGFFLCSYCKEYSQNVTNMEDTDNNLCENCDRSFYCEKCEKSFEEVENGICPNCGPDEPEEEETEPVKTPYYF